MSLYIASLNSGSNGNCYYIGNGQDAVLVDAGLSCRETEKRMKQLGLSLENVRAIFISHEHGDHIKGLEVLSRKHRLPVHISAKTLRQSRLQLMPHLTQPLDPDSTVQVNELRVHSFSKWHDAAEPCSFMIESKGVKVGVFTDIGAVCSRLPVHFRQCHAAFLEANYDEQMLEEGPYPYSLKKRIRGGKGHLSNAQALQLLQDHRPPTLSHLLLSHLSRENNHPDMVTSLFRPHAGHTKILIASRDEPSAVYEIHSGEGEIPGVVRPKPLPVKQLGLF